MGDDSIVHSSVIVTYASSVTNLSILLLPSSILTQHRCHILNNLKPNKYVHLTKK